MTSLIQFIIGFSLFFIANLAAAENIDSVCDANYGLIILNQVNPPLSAIKEILAFCDVKRPNDSQVLLLHGLLARKEGMANQDYQLAIDWLKKAQEAAATDDLVPALELAVTYEWAGQLDKAKQSYEHILKQDPASHAGLLGAARVAIAENRLDDASALYKSVLQKNDKDIEALNGLGRVKMAENDLIAAQIYFERTLLFSPSNTEAKLGLQQIAASVQETIKEEASPECDANKALALLSQTSPPVARIKNMLEKCDKAMPKEVQTLLLHGLLARYQHNYPLAISWLEKAKLMAAPGNLQPAFELAVTYEWDLQPEKAKLIYEEILAKNPALRPATLGLARVALAENHPDIATKIYQDVLQKNPDDKDALNGLAQVERATKVQRAAIAPLPAPGKAPCEANKGLSLLNQQTPPFSQIKEIINHCQQTTADDVQFLLLQGLFARSHEAYPKAIEWLEKAKLVAAANNLAPALELGVTYEWSKEFVKAKLIYDEILQKEPNSRPGLLGSARVAVDQHRLQDASHIYQRFLQQNAKDTDALNGLARVNLVSKQFVLAKDLFEKILRIDPNNKEARVGLEQTNKAIQQIKWAAAQKLLQCNANEGLLLLNQANPPYDKINHILALCDQQMPNDSQVLFLHGLLARKAAQSTGHYQTAIDWLEKAAAASPSNNPGPNLELAATYEWAGYFARARAIYGQILAQNPDFRPAILGAGRVALAQYRIADAAEVYRKMLRKNAKDIDALNGLAWVKLTNKEYNAAKLYFENSLEIKPNDPDALRGLMALKKATRYLLTMNKGIYSVQNERSYGTTVNFYADLNATDKFLLLATNNTKEIQLDLITDPTILPRNEVYVGFQRQLQNRYGWGVGTQFRQRKNVPVENRIDGNANIYLLPNVQLFAGGRDGFPSPWNNKLLYSGLTLYTKWPVNITTTGFWAREQFAGFTEAYALDLSKEFPNRAFYNLGTTYSVTQRSWEIHSRVIVPITANQAVEGLYIHYYFNGTNVASLGWRVYWK